MADLPYDRELDAHHAQLRRDARRTEEQRRARAAAARDDLHAAAATPTGGPPRTQRRRVLLSVGEELALERAARAAGVSVATFVRAAALHFVARIDPGRDPSSRQRSDRDGSTPPPTDRSAVRTSDPGHDDGPFPQSDL